MGMHVSDYMFSIQHGPILKEVNIAKSNALAFGNASIEITTKNKAASAVLLEGSCSQAVPSNHWTIQGGKRPAEGLHQDPLVHFSRHREEKAKSITPPSCIQPSTTEHRMSNRLEVELRSGPVSRNVKKNAGPSQAICFIFIFY